MALIKYIKKWLKRRRKRTPGRKTDRYARGTDYNCDPKCLPLKTFQDRLKQHAAWLDSRGAMGKRLQLRGCYISSSDAETSPFKGAILREADLRDVAFGKTDVSGTHFEDSDLNGADLSQVTGLQAANLAGANLNHAKLPDGFKFDDIQHVEEMSKNCGKYLVTVLAGCAYILLTIYTTSDAALLTNSATAMLPFLQAGVPIIGFYFFAPVLLLMLYGFFHMNLQVLWETVARLPATFPDGRDVVKTSYPWIVNHIVSLYAKRLPHSNRLSDILTWFAVTCLTTFTVPCTLIFVWGRCLCRHMQDFSDFHSAMIALSLFGATLFMIMRSGALLRNDKHLRRCKHPFADGIARVCFIIALAASFAVFKALSFVSNCAISSVPKEPLAVSLLDDKDRRHPANQICLNVLQSTGKLLHCTCHIHANMEGADVSARPQYWIAKDKDEFQSVKGASLRGAKLPYLTAPYAYLVRADLRDADLLHANLAFADLRYAQLNPTAGKKDTIGTLRGAELKKADLRSISAEQADLEWCDLTDVDLSGANLQGAHLNNATLTKADLRSVSAAKANFEWCDLTEANLSDADLHQADLRNTILDEANLSGANLQNAHIENARLGFVNLSKADLRFSYMMSIDTTKPDFSHAKLQGTNLLKAKLTNGDFSEAELAGANMARADLTDAKMVGLDFGTAILQDACLKGAFLYGSDLRNALFLTQEQVNVAYGDANTQLSARLKHPSTWPRFAMKLQKK